MMILYCDICKKRLQNKTVMMDTDPLDYRYGEFDIEFSIGLNGDFDLEFGDVCHECARKIQNINIEVFKEFFIEKCIKQWGSEEMKCKECGAEMYLDDRNTKLNAELKEN